MRIFTFLLMIPFFAFNSCKKDTPVIHPVTINEPPVAHAGLSQIILFPTDIVELVGSGTDSDGKIVSYQWDITAYFSKIGQYKYFKYRTATIKLKNLNEGTYWCKLTVTDDGGLSATDQVIVKVVAADCPCYPDPCDAFGDPCDPWDY